MQLNVSKSFTAVAISRGEEYDKMGFYSYDAAEQWIVENYCCKSCQQEYKNGEDCACLAEWCILETGKYMECRNIHDIMKVCFENSVDPVKDAPNHEKCDNYKALSKKNGDSQPSKKRNILDLVKNALKLVSRKP